MNFLSILFLIFSPAIVALLLLSPIFPNNNIKIRRFSKGFSITHFIYSLLFLLYFNPTNLGWSYQKELTFFGSSWINTLGIRANFGLDGISLVFVILTSFITMLAIIAGKRMIRTKTRIYYPLVLILQTAVLGVFSAKDIFLFLFFWLLELIPTYLLINQWGEKTSKSAATKYIICSFLGSMFLILGMLILYFYSFAISGVLTADIENLSMSENVFAMWFQAFIFFCFLIGFAIKLPIVPLHTAQFTAQNNSIAPVSMLLSGLLMNMGGYGIIRFNLGLFPEVFDKFAPILMILGGINMLYCTTLAFIQTDIKKVVSLYGIAQCGLILLGLGAMTEVGFEGSIFHMISRSIISAGLFMLVGSIYLRTKTTQIFTLSGLGEVMPICKNFGIIITLAAMGLPFLSGFAANFIILNGIILSDIEPQGFIVTIGAISALGVFLSAACIFRLFNDTFLGSVTSKFKKLNNKENNIVILRKPITKTEIIVLASLALAVMFLGIFPNSILDIFKVTTDVIIDFMKV